MDLAHIKNLLVSTVAPPAERIGRVIDAITDAQKAGGEIHYLTPSCLVPHNFTVRFQVMAPDRHEAYKKLFDKLDKIQLVFWVEDVTHPAASSHPVTDTLAPLAASSESLKAWRAEVAANSEPHLGAFLIHLRDLSQAMLGMCDAKAPDQAARDASLKAWRDLRDTIDAML